MTEGVCYTFEAAIEKAIEMEENGFRSYLKAISILKNEHARAVLRDSALDEVNIEMKTSDRIMLTKALEKQLTKI